MGGTNDPSNLVSVTVEEHANLHKQLWEDLWYEEDRIAWLCLSGQIKMSDAALLSIENGRKKGLETRKRNKKPRSEESKNKQRQKMKGKKPWNFGKKRAQIPWNKGKKNIYSEETLKLMSIAKKGSKITDEITKQRVLYSIITEKHYCDCGCNKEYNIGNLTKHKHKNALTENL